VTVAVLFCSLAALALLTALLVLQLRRGGAEAATMVQQQLIELRSRLDALAFVQQEVPQALAQGRAEQAESLADVREQLVRMSEATARLETVGRSVAEVQQLLQVPRLRGTIGEIWLEELLRQVFPSSLYSLQHGFKSGDRVDAVVRVGDRLIPIDSKFPLEACQRMLGSQGPDADRERRAFHRALKDRIDEIADKYIRPDEGTYEFALMYVPAENVYYEAFVRGGDVDIECGVSAYALERKVVPVSPNTFYAYLSAIVHGLRGLEVEKSAREILESLGTLEQQFLHFGRAYDLVGKHLTNAAKQHDEAERQLGLIRGKLDSIRQLGAAHQLEQPNGESRATIQDN
jgi:DNA recombination protein RmuC